ncbi:MAG TPA: hypothetical protein VFE62_17180 [Gemmataceae bacterium]|nr:hypothetical protein [Gemmataceae bacterium]
MIRRLLCLLTVASGCLLALSATQAQEEKKKTEKTKEQIQQERMQRLTLAFDLAAEGRKRNAQEYLITAAGMLRRLSEIPDLKDMEKFKEKLEITGPGKAEADKDITPKTLLKLSDELFKEASDNAVAAGYSVDKLIKAAKERETSDKEERDVVGGPRAIAKLIGPGQTHTYTFSIFSHAHTRWAIESSHPVHVNVVHLGPPNAVLVNHVGQFATANWYPLSWNPAYYAKVKATPITIRVMNNLKAPVKYQMIIQ